MIINQFFGSQISIICLYLLPIYSKGMNNMVRHKKRLFYIVPLVIFSGVASTSFVEQDTLMQSCYQQPTCDAIAKTLNWGDWLSGSSSAQFHFIDLLELISSF